MGLAWKREPPRCVDMAASIKHRACNRPLGAPARQTFVTTVARLRQAPVPLAYALVGPRVHVSSLAQAEPQSYQYSSSRLYRPRLQVREKGYVTGGGPRQPPIYGHSHMAMSHVLNY